MTPTELDYPIIAIGDLHGQLREIERLLQHLERLPEWPSASVVFLGDFVDRGPDPRGVIDLVLDVLARDAGGSAVCGNHDRALVGAARLDDGAPCGYWQEHYREMYECRSTLVSYLGERYEEGGRDWPDNLSRLRETMPETHRRFLADLPWVVEAEGHLFLHNGLSDELEASAEDQVAALRERVWDRQRLGPRAGTRTDTLWTDHYPVWLGADRTLSADPLPHPTKVQVTGHARVSQVDADAVRIRIDTSGGHGVLTACLLRSPGSAPVFFSSG